MRGLWCVASFAAANSQSNNVSSVLSNLDIAPQPSSTSQSDAATNQLASAIANALGSQFGSTTNNSKNQIDVGKLFQSAVGDGTNPGVLSYINQLGISPSSGATNTVRASELGIEKTNMNPTQQLDLAHSVLTDSTSLMNQSSLSNLFPALTGGLLSNAGAGNLLGALNNGNSRQMWSTISGVITDPQILNSAASLTKSPVLQGATALSNIGSSVASGIDISNALKQRALSQMESRRLTDTAGALDLSALTNTLLGSGANALNLGSLASGLLGGSNTGGINLSSLANGLLGGGATGAQTGLDPSTLTNSLQSLTGALGTANTFQALANSTMPLTSLSSNAAPVSNKPASNALDGVAATFISNNYLNSAGQIALKSTPFAQKALQYPDLVAVLNGQAPINAADGHLTPAVQTALKQMNISATTPAALISVISSTDSQDQSTNPLANPLSNLSGLTGGNLALANTTAILEESQKALQDSLASLTNTNSANNSVQGLLSGLGSPSGTNDLLASLLKGTQSRVLAEEPTEQASEQSTTEGEINGLRDALIHFNEALKKAIRANEGSMEVKKTANSAELVAEGDTKHRMLDNWFSSAWDRIKNTFNGGESSESAFQSTDWKNEVNHAAQELADNLNTMADKIRGTDVANLIDNWFDRAKEDLASKATEVMPKLTIGSVSESPSRIFSGISPGVSQEVANRRLGNAAQAEALAAGYNFLSAGRQKDNAFSAGVENYNFQSVDQNGHALVNGRQFQSVGNKENALAAGFDEYKFQQALGGNVLGGDLLGGQLFPANGMFAGIQPVINSLTSPFFGAINSLGAGSGTGGGLLQNNPLQQLLNGNSNTLKLFQENSHNTEYGDAVVQSSVEIQSNQLPNIQELSKIAAMLNQLQALSYSHFPAQHQQQEKQPQNNQIPVVNQSDSTDAHDVKSLNSIDVKDWINKLGGTELGKTFGLDQLDLSKLPILPNIEDADLEKFMEQHDWQKVFDSLRLSDLPGLQGENESTLKQQVKDGHLGEILAKVDLSNLPGLENISVDSILKSFNDAREAENSISEGSTAEASEKADSRLRRLQNSASSIISNGSSSLSDTLTSGATSSLLSSQNSLLNQLQGITNLADGLTGLTSGLGYGLTNLNANALTGSSVLTSGIGNLLGNVNTGLGSNLNNLGSGLSGLTSSIGSNLNQGLGATGSGLGSGQLNLFDLSGLANLIPTTAASNLSDSIYSPIQPVLSSYGLTSVPNTAAAPAASSAATSAAGSGEASVNPSSATLSTSNQAASSLSATDINNLLASLNQAATQVSAAASPTSETSSKSDQRPGTALQMLHAFVGMRRMLSSGANASPIELLNQLTAQLTGGNAANSGASLLNSLSSSLNVPAASTSSLDSLLSSLNSSLSGPNASQTTPVVSSAGGSSQFQSATSNGAGSSGVAIPDLQSILGGSYKQLQSAPSSSDPVSSILSSATNSTPELSSLLGAANSLPDLDGLLQNLSAASNLNAPNIPSLAGLSLNQVPNTNDLLAQLSAGSTANLTETLNQSLASLTNAASPISLTSPLTNLPPATNALPDISSLLQLGATPLSLDQITSNMLNQLALATAAPATAGSPDKAGDHVLSALNDISGRRLEGISVSDYVKELEREEILAEGLLSSIFRQNVAQIKAQSGDKVADAEQAQLQIAILEADYKAKMESIGQLAKAQKIYATQYGENLAKASAGESVVASGQAAGEKTSQSANAVVVDPLMGNAFPNTNAVSRRLLLSERVINLEPNSAPAGAGYLTSTPEPELPGEHTRPEEWIEDYMPPVLKSVLDIISPVRPAPPPYHTSAVKSGTYRVPSGVRKLQVQQPFRYDAFNINPNSAIPAANNLPAAGPALFSPSYSASWQPNGGNRISGFYPYGGGDGSLGSVSGALGFDIGQFPGASAVSSANRIDAPLWQASANGGILSSPNWNNFNNQFLSVDGSASDANIPESVQGNESVNNNQYSPVLGERFDPVSILTAISNSDLNVPGLFQMLADSNVDWNRVVTRLRNGATFESLVPEMINDGLDVPAILALVNQSNLNLNTVLNDDKSSNPRISSLEDLLAQLDGLDLNALIKSTAVSGIDLKSVILMLNKDGIDLQSVADSPVMPIIGHAAAVSQLEDAFNPHNEMIDPHVLLHAMENVEHELEPL